jgi:N utilization substance protein A
VIVPDDQLSLAIGREGQNARLAAKLTGWRIDIKSVTEAVTSALNNLNAPHLAEVRTKHALLIADVERIVVKKSGNLTIQPEEYATLNKFADVVEHRLLAIKLEARQARLAEINAVKMTLPPQAFEIPVTKLDLPDNIIEALQPLENAGEIMLRFLIDESRLRRLLSNQADDALILVQNALDKLVLPDAFADFDSFDLPSEETAAASAPTSAPPAAAPMPGDGDEDFAEAVMGGEPGKAAAADDDYDELPTLEEDDDEFDGPGKGGKSKKKKKERNQRRQLIFDEDMGEVVVKRRRKGGRKGGGWGDFEE